MASQLAQHPTVRERWREHGTLASNFRSALTPLLCPQGTGKGSPEPACTRTDGAMSLAQWAGRLGQERAMSATLKTIVCSHEELLGDVT